MEKNLLMPTRKNISGACWELFFSGKIDGAAANEMEMEVLNAIKAGADEIFLNMAEAEFLCSAGIRVIMQYFRQMRSNGKKLLVARPSPQVEAILEMTGFKELVVERPSSRA
jgi:anti-sigma B factor antagonist